MISNWSLARKLGLGFSIPVLFLILTGIGSLNSLGRTQAGLETVYDDRVVPLRGLKIIADAYAVDVIDAVNKANAGRSTAEQAKQSVDRAMAEIDREWKAYLATHLVPEEQALVEQAKTLFAAADADIERLNASLSGMYGSVEGQLGDFDGALYDSIDPISGKISELIELQLRVAKQEYDQAGETYAQARLLTIAAIVLAALIAAWLGWAISRGLIRQLGGEPADAAAAVQRIARGNLDQDVIPRSSGASLLGDLRQLQLNLREFIAAQRDMSTRHEAGEMGFRIDAEKFPGAWGEIARQVNALVGAQIAITEQVMSLLGRYAIGDLQADMAELPGQKAVITRTMATAKSNLLAISAEIERLVNAAAAGDFSSRGEAQRFQFAFKAMIESLNRLMSEADSGLSDVGASLTALAEGDLQRNVDRQYEGAFGRLAGDVNDTLQRLRDIVGGIRISAERINTAASEIASGNADLAERTEQQAANLEETAASMEELTSTVQQNAENSKLARQLASDSGDVANRGGQVMQQVVTTMGEISSASNKIEEIISVIDGIAFQTNILALNAAVEAARAGEQGRGFAVVASEVRALAQRSADAAKEIKGLISESSQKVDAGSELVNQAGNTMQEVVNSVQRVADLVREISGASEEQSSGIQQVSHTVVQMDQATQQNAALVEEATAAARALEAQASELLQSVSVFR